MTTLNKRALWLGTLATILLTIASWSNGATRTRGGVVRYFHMDWIMYGHGAGLGFALSWIALALLCYSWCLWGRQVRLGQIDLKSSVRILIFWCAPMIVAEPLYSRDVYSYLMQGAMVRDGFNPYVDGAAVNPGPMLLEVSPDWRNTTTPYGPLHLWIGDIITTIVGSNITVGVLFYKVISLIGYAAICWAVIAIAREIGGRAQEAVWLGVANPLVFLHLVGGMHNESSMVAFSCLGLLLALRRHPYWGAVLIGFGVSLKATAAVALPFLVWIAVRNYTQKVSAQRAHLEPGKSAGSTAVQASGHSVPWITRLGVFFSRGFICLAIVIAVLEAVTMVSGSSWGWVSQLSGNTKVINLLALPSFLAQFTASWVASMVPGATFNSVLEVYRTACMVLMVVFLAIVWWLFRKNQRDAIRGTAIAYLVTCIFNAVTLPWYYAAGLVLVGTYNPKPWVKQFTIIGSLVVAASFTPSGNNWLYRWSWMWLVFIVSVILYYAVYGDIMGSSAAATEGSSEHEHTENSAVNSSEKESHSAGARADKPLATHSGGEGTLTVPGRDKETE